MISLLKVGAAVDDEGCHGFDDRDGADGDAGIMPGAFYQEESHTRSEDRTSNVLDVVGEGYYQEPVALIEHGGFSMGWSLSDQLLYQQSVFYLRIAVEKDEGGKPESNADILQRRYP